MTGLITVEVAFALPQKQSIVSVQVPLGTTALEAIEQSAIASLFPEINLASAKIGIFGQSLGTKSLDIAARHILQQGDRVEIYRPLISDPKDARRKRAEKNADAGDL